MIAAWFVQYRPGLYAALFASVWLHGCHTGAEHVRSEFTAFVDDVRAKGTAAQAAADAQKALDIKRKESTDADYTKRLVALRADIGKLRSARTNYLPTPSTDTGSAERACFARADLERAIRAFDEGVSGLVAEGDETRLKLDTAIRWGQ